MPDNTLSWPLGSPADAYVTGTAVDRPAAPLRAPRGPGTSEPSSVFLPLFPELRLLDHTYEHEVHPWARLGLPLIAAPWMTDVVKSFLVSCPDLSPDALRQVRDLVLEHFAGADLRYVEHVDPETGHRDLILQVVTGVAHDDARESAERRLFDAIERAPDLHRALRHLVLSFD